MSRDVFIIAEAGCNHNGDPKIAAKLIREAGACGADAVKFQIFRAENLISRDLKKTAHLKNIGRADSVFKAMKDLEFGGREYMRLKGIAQREGIVVFASVFDIESLRLTNEIGFPILKIPSGEIVNLELLNEASKCGKPIIMSTGMATLAEVRRAVKIISKNLLSYGFSNKQLFYKYPIFKKGVILMHAVSAYPARSDELNLKAISTLKKVFDLPVGYSDHSIGYEASLIAASLGAEVIEKHFTLDKNMYGPDHKASAEPKELKDLISKIRAIGEMMGDGIKRPSKSEKPMLKIFRRAIVARYDIPKGTAINRSNVMFKRPLDGVPIERFKDIDGMTARAAIKKDMPILDSYVSRKAAI